MYLSGGNATRSESLTPPGNYVMWSEYKRQNPAERADIKSYYVITRETLAHKTFTTI